jgi:hypothetical protein
MDRAQELQKWFCWENGKMVMVVPHTFLMVRLHIKQLMFYPRNWDLAFYGILHFIREGKSPDEKTLHFVLIFFANFHFFASFPELMPELYKTTAFHHLPIQC